MSHSWNAAAYEQRHAYVYQYGEALLDLLAPQPGERILDLGCGAGQLTAAIAKSGAIVVGMDSSPEMIRQARHNFPEIQFELGDAADFELSHPVDALFSNAALHWVKDRADAARCVARALKPGGRLVAECGGHGNVASVVAAVRQVLGPDVEFPWTFPSVGEYATLLEAHGLEVREARLFDRLTRVEGEDGMESWLAMFGASVVADLPAVQQAETWHRVAALLRPEAYQDGGWWVDYRRLRVVAVRPERAFPRLF
jgi:trans-aconitate 2-methyltransferase